MDNEEGHIEIPDPTAFERIISWVKIVFATRKAALFLWAMFFGVSGTAIVGQVTDTKPFKEAAIELGLIDAQQIAQVATEDAVLDEVLNLQGDVQAGLTTITEMQQEIRDLKQGLEAVQEAVDAPVSYDLPEHTHPPPDLAHEHTEYALKGHTDEHEAKVLLSSEVQAILESEVKRVFEIELEGHIDLLH